MVRTCDTVRTSVWDQPLPRGQLLGHAQADGALDVDGFSTVSKDVRVLNAVDFGLYPFVPEPDPEEGPDSWSEIAALAGGGPVSCEQAAGLFPAVYGGRAAVPQCATGY